MSANKQVSYDTEPTDTPPECIHSIIEDLIDITPDRSKYVYYCEKCYKCFDTICGKNPR